MQEAFRILERFITRVRPAREKRGEPTQRKKEGYSQHLEYSLDQMVGLEVRIHNYQKGIGEALVKVIRLTYNLKGAGLIVSIRRGIDPNGPQELINCVQANEVITILRREINFRHKNVYVRFLTQWGSHKIEVETIGDIISEISKQEIPGDDIDKLTANQLMNINTIPYRTLKQPNSN